MKKALKGITRIEYDGISTLGWMVRITRGKIGEETALLLLAAPDAMGYYPKIGFTKAENAWIIPRLH